MFGWIQTFHLRSNINSKFFSAVQFVFAWAVSLFSQNWYVEITKPSASRGSLLYAMNNYQISKIMTYISSSQGYWPMWTRNFAFLESYLSDFSYSPVINKPALLMYQISLLLFFEYVLPGCFMTSTWSSVWDYYLARICRVSDLGL